jgi:tetratricopeptide (TPR) repeat protein
LLPQHLEERAITMTFVESTLRVQRGLVAAVLFGSTVIFVPAMVEPFMLPKATIAVALAVVLTALGAARALWAREVHLPVAPVTAAVAAFAFALVIATVTSATPLASVIGFYSRYTGLAPYLAYLVIFFVTLRLADLAFVRLLIRTALVALGFVVTYGLLQAAGLEPLGYNEDSLGGSASFLGNFSFLGNTNFSAAWTGAVSSLALITALSPAEHRAWRIVAALLLPWALLYTVLTGSAQGPITAAIALASTGLMLAAAPDGRLREAVAARRGLVLAVAGGVVAAIGVGLAVVLASARSQLDRALVDRPEFWQAALRIFSDNPVLGTGLDTYAHFFQAYRPTSLAITDGVATTDAPHSVPLGMLSNGGLLLGVAYAAVVVLVGVALVRGVLHAQGPTRLAVAGWGGVWLGYQAQSLISFDVPPLALLHFLSAGIIVAFAAPPRWKAIALPGPAAARPVNRRGKQYGAYTVPTSTRVLQGAVAAVALAALWLAAYPLRADLTAASAQPLANSGRIDEAIDRFNGAAELNPAEASYPFLAARGHDALGQHADALASAAEAARRDPGTVQYALFAASQAEDAGDEEAARRWYRDAVARDPNDPPVLAQAGSYLLGAGDAQAAEPLLERSVALQAKPVSLVLLGRARGEQGDLVGAREAFEQALKLEPGNEAAEQALRDMDAAG